MIAFVEALMTCQDRDSSCTPLKVKKYATLSIVYITFRAEKEIKKIPGE
jgi:hypothetical protein